MDRLTLGLWNECLTCGSHVNPNFAAVYGDEQNCAHRWPTCDVSGRLDNGSAAGLDLDRPDPLEHPQRFDAAISELPDHVRSLVDQRANLLPDGGGAP